MRLPNILKEYLKFFIKNLTPLLGRVLLIFNGREVNKVNWSNRLLIIFAGGIGDVVKRSVICKYLKNFLPEYEKYYLIPYDGLELPYAEKTLYFDYKKIKLSPLYYFKFVNKLREIGFKRIIVLLPFWEGFLPKLANDLKAEEIFCPLETPPYLFYKIISKINTLLHYKSIKKRFKLIPVASIFDKDLDKEYFPSDVLKHKIFISEVIKNIKNFPAGEINIETETEILVDNNIEKEVLKKLEDIYNIKPKQYCILGLGSSAFHKNWPVERFVKVAEFLYTKNLIPIIVGNENDKVLGDKFKNLYNKIFIDMIGKTSLKELVVLIKNSLLVIGNDTSFIHIAIALKCPSICIISNKQLGVDSLYGYKDINKWVYSNEKCKTSFEAILNISTEDVIFVTNDLLKYLENTKNYPISKFSLSFYN